MIDIQEALSELGLSGRLLSYETLTLNPHQRELYSRVVLESAGAATTQAFIVRSFSTRDGDKPHERELVKTLFGLQGEQGRSPYTSITRVSDKFYAEREISGLSCLEDISARLDCGTTAQKTYHVLADLHARGYAYNHAFEQGVLVHTLPPVVPDNLDNPQGIYLRHLAGVLPLSITMRDADLAALRTFLHGLYPMQDGDIIAARQLSYHPDAVLGGGTGS